MSNQPAQARLVADLLHTLNSINSPDDDQESSLPYVSSTMETCLHGLLSFLQESGVDLTLAQTLNLLLYGVSSPFLPGSQYNGVDYVDLLEADGGAMGSLDSIGAILDNSRTHAEYSGLNLEQPLATYNFGHDLLTADRTYTEADWLAAQKSKG